METDPRLKDFRNFLFLCWQHLNLPEPTPVQYDMAEYVQSGPKRSIIQAFRGVGKSYITSAFVCHQLLLNPELKFLVVSASKARADDFSTFTLRLIAEIPILRHLHPSDDQRSSKIAFDVGPAQAAHSPSVKSVGITGMLTGSRADYIIADDVESANNSMTEGMRTKLAETVKEFDAILKPDGRIIYLGTPQTEQSLYDRILNRGYDCRIWPARHLEDDQKITYGNRLAPFIDKAEGEPGTSTDPRRFSDTDLMEREASYGKSGFALQFMLDTKLADTDRYPLKLSDMVVTSIDPKRGPCHVVWASSPELKHRDLHNVGMDGDGFYRPMSTSDDFAEFQGVAMSIDPSGRGKDETAYAVVKCLHGQLFLVDAGGFRGGYSTETLQALAHTAKTYGVNFIVIESNFGDGMFSSLFKPVLGKIHPTTIEEVRHSKQKELRIIDTLEPVLNQHRLIVDPKVIQKDYDTSIGYAAQVGGERAEKYSLFYQMSRLTRDRGSLLHDDRLDALSIVINYWTESLARDVEGAAEAHREALIRAELEHFMEITTGARPAQATWMDI
ncbi:MAG: DNA maturase B [Magnetovibrio sp.]|nr:DNA maturase B [Magnetovibrio sp.]